MKNFIVTIGDLRSVGICPSGTRRWFGEQGLDFHHFMKNGIEAEKLLATKCGVAESAVKKIWERKNGR